MGQEDISEKLLADHNDVFADIMNVLLFNGNPLMLCSNPIARLLLKQGKG